jgi:hypothetical protein
LVGQWWNRQRPCNPPLIAPSRDARQLLRLLRVLALIVVFMFPMQMRAGADDPHPHSALQLLLDARDGMVDHHSPAKIPASEIVDGHGAHVRTATSAPDLPSFGESNLIGGVAMLAAVVMVFSLPTQPRLTWTLPVSWQGRLPALDPPPPRQA